MKWQNFYVIVGPSAAALIGVQFVVVTLSANRRTRPSPEALYAFATPTVLHLGISLLLSTLMVAPWPSPRPASVVLAACGLGGLGYLAVVARLTRRQTHYRPVWEDWLCYVIAPGGLYATLSTAALLLGSATEVSLFLTAGVSLGLLLVGIRNAWDSVTHIVLGPGDEGGDSRP